MDLNKGPCFGIIVYTQNRFFYCPDLVSAVTIYVNSNKF